MARKLKMALDGSVRGWAVLHSIAKGEAWKGLVVGCFDCGKPGGWDWVTGRIVVETDKRADAGKVIALVAWGMRWEVARHGVERTVRKKWCLG